MLRRRPTVIQVEQEDIDELDKIRDKAKEAKAKQDEMAKTLGTPAFAETPERNMSDKRTTRERLGLPPQPVVSTPRALPRQ